MTSCANLGQPIDGPGGTLLHDLDTLSGEE
jgi:hypothetical protein